MHKRWDLLAFGFGVICLIDAANCIRLEHFDWFLPAALAVWSGSLIGRVRHD